MVIDMLAYDHCNNLFSFLMLLSQSAEFEFWDSRGSGYRGQKFLVCDIV
jgi:hypothetical protein